MFRLPFCETLGVNVRRWPVQVNEVAERFVQVTVDGAAMRGADGNHLRLQLGHLDFSADVAEMFSLWPEK
jgi:hypothetical protein